jgi:GntR family transcriptional regulator
MRPVASLHGQVRAELARRISSGGLPRNGQLPTERELSAEFGVSRVTVRRALASLAEDGLVHAVQGRGTFVSPVRVAEPPNALLSFRELAASRNLVAGARLLEAEVRPATISEAEQLEVAPGADLFHLERLRTLDGVPVALDASVVPVALAPELPRLDWSTASLYARLADAGHVPVRADYAVEAQGADARVAEHLELPVGAPVLVAESLTYGADDRLVEIGRMVYRGDRYRFRSTLLADGAAPGPRQAHGSRR